MNDIFNLPENYNKLGHCIYIYDGYTYECVSDIMTEDEALDRWYPERAHRRKICKKLLES